MLRRFGFLGNSILTDFGKICGDPKKLDLNA